MDIYVDHDELKKYFIPRDVKITRTYDESGCYMSEYITRIETLKKYDVYYFTNSHGIDVINGNNNIIAINIDSNINGNNIIFAINIDSKIMTKCHICINDSAVTNFRVFKNNHQYFHLIFMRYNVVKLVLKRDSVRCIDVVSVNSFNNG